MHDLKFLHENIFRGDAEVRPPKVDKLLNDYQNLSSDDKKEFINLFFNEKVYDITKLQEELENEGAILFVLRNKELA